MEKIKFGFTPKTVTMDEAEFQKKSEAENNRFLGVGKHVVTIANAQFHSNKDTKSIYCTKDDTWFNVKLSFTVGNSKQDAWIQVPTSRIEFNPEQSKKPLFVFGKFRSFMAALGVQVLSDPKSLSKLVPKYFSDPSKLNGKQMEITIAYTGPYIKKEGEDTFKIVNQNGTDHEILTDLYGSRDEAKLAAVSAGLKYMQNFPEITTYAEVPKTKKKAAPKKKEAVEAPTEEVETVIENTEEGDW